MDLVLHSKQYSFVARCPYACILAKAVEYLNKLASFVFYNTDQIIV